MLNWLVFGGTNKLVFTWDPSPIMPALNCRGPRVSVNLMPELSMLSVTIYNYATQGYKVIIIR